MWFSLVVLVGVVIYRLHESWEWGVLGNIWVVISSLLEEMNTQQRALISWKQTVTVGKYKDLEITLCIQSFAYQAGKCFLFKLIQVKSKIPSKRKFRYICEPISEMWLLPKRITVVETNSNFSLVKTTFSWRHSDDVSSDFLPLVTLFKMTMLKVQRPGVIKPGLKNFFIQYKWYVFLLILILHQLWVQRFVKKKIILRN